MIWVRFVPTENLIATTLVIRKMTKKWSSHAAPYWQELVIAGWTSSEATHMNFTIRRIIPHLHKWGSHASIYITLYNRNSFLLFWPLKADVLPSPILAFGSFKGSLESSQLAYKGWGLSVFLTHTASSPINKWELVEVNHEAESLGGRKLVQDTRHPCKGSQRGGG